MSESVGCGGRVRLSPRENLLPLPPSRFFLNLILSSSILYPICFVCTHRERERERERERGKQSHGKERESYRKYKEIESERERA